LRAKNRTRGARATTVVLVDDDEIVRIGLRDFLATSLRFEVVGESATAREAFRLIEVAEPDVVVMDLVMRGMDGVIATREILRRVSRSRVLILSAHGQTQDVLDAMDAGAAGYVLKADEPETLIRALDVVSRGELYLSRRLAQGLSAARQDKESLTARLAVLSEREREIFRLSAECQGANEIARELCLARKTVDTHLNRIHRKLKLRNQAELVRLAFSIGLVHSVRPGSGQDRASLQPSRPPET
jgi:DNA-binding NarL/FixJ family response regulator